MKNLLAFVILSSASVAFAAPAASVNPEPAAVDIAAYKDKLVVWTDGKKHYIAMVMTSHDPPFFWSRDGKTFYSLRVRSGGSEGADDALVNLNRTVIDPRTQSMTADLRWTKASGKLTVECGERNTALEKAADGAKIVAGGKFVKPLWSRRAYALVRDPVGKYYYVDNAREPENAKSFHLYFGPKGAMKQQKMTNVVSDSEGDIFSTTLGDLRLILSKKESSWIVTQGKPQKLTWVPVEDNGPMIYNDLGVYTGERFGTPCDEL